jgi:hypothetical protein
VQTLLLSRHRKYSNLLLVKKSWRSAAAKVTSPRVDAQAGSRTQPPLKHKTMHIKQRMLGKGNHGETRPEEMAITKG